MKKLIKYFNEKKWRLPFFLALVYFSLSFITLKDYGISWDETIHFRRGQSYLYYFLTGKLNYNNLPEPILQGTNGNPKLIPFPRRSIYQSDVHNGEYFMKNDAGHPPLGGEIASLFNYIFYQKLGILPDITSYHIYNILAATIGVFAVGYFAVETMGLFPATVSVLVLCTYPLFWAESHFNIKDPAETAFFTVTLLAFWNFLQKKTKRWLFFSFLFFAFAISIKFNALFIFFILAVFLVLYFKFSGLRLNIDKIKLFIKSYWTTFVAGLAIIAVIFIGAWPFLWQNLPTNLLSIVKYYEEIGTGAQYQPSNYFFFGFNLYPTTWILATTPPITLLLTLFGIVAIFSKKVKKDVWTWLWLIWLIFPVLRVTLPGMAVYGGSRQIMEFLPAMALISGYGVKYFYEFTRKKLLLKYLVIGFVSVGFCGTIYRLIDLHPNENVYFNFIIGGLKGAEKIKLPSYGNSFGNAYLEGAKWINKNVPQGSKLTLLQGAPSNMPPIWIRSDIRYLVDGKIDPVETYFSGINRGGEYIVELAFNDSNRNYYYAWEYVEKFLTPVYEEKVDGVPILKIWKNDLAHTVKTYQTKEKKILSFKKVLEKNNLIEYQFEKNIRLSRLIYFYEKDNRCSPLINTYIESSLDSVNWLREKDSVLFPQLGGKPGDNSGNFTYYFAGRETKFVRIVFDSGKSCGLNTRAISFIEI